LVRLLFEDVVHFDNDIWCSDEDPFVVMTSEHDKAKRWRVTLAWLLVVAGVSLMIVARVWLGFGESSLVRHVAAMLMIGGGMLIAVVGWRLQTPARQV